MKKLQMLVALLIVAVLVLSGCGTKTEEVKGTGESKESNTKETSKEKDSDGGTAEVQEALEHVELSWYYIGSPQADQVAVYEKANEIIKDKINATVNFQVIDWGSYDDKMNLMINAGETFDLCFTSNWSNNYVQNVQKDAFLPLDGLLDEYAPTLRSIVPDKFWDATRVEGEIYGIINYQISTMTNAVSINKALADKYDFDPDSVKTLEDLEPFFAAIAENESDVTPLNNHAAAGSMWGRHLARVGFDEIAGRNIPGVVRVADGEATVINQFESPEFLEWAETMRDYYNKGYIRSDAISINDDTADMQAGKIAVYTEGNYSPSSEVDNLAKFGFETYVRPISKPALFTSSIIATMQGISRTSENPERAMMLMELVNTDVELYNLLSYGIEGTHYEKLDGNYIRPIADSGYNPGTKWLFGSTGNAYLLEGSQADVWEKTVEMNEIGTPSPLLGFSFNSEPVNSQIAQCNSVVDEFIAAIDTGSMEVEDVLPQFQEKLTNAGAADIIAEMQAQIDAWKAAK